MLTQYSSATMMTLPAMTSLSVRLADAGSAPEPFLMEADEAPVMYLEAAPGRKMIIVSAKRLVFLSEVGGMTGKRFETFSVRLSQISAFVTCGPGGMSGEAQVSLLIAGIGEISLGFDKEADLTPLVSHLTARVGVPG
jgi:hypothetical protein